MLLRLVLRYTDYLNYIKDHISHVLLLILVHVLILLTSCLTAIKTQVIKYCDIVYGRSGISLSWSIKNSGETLNKLISNGFLASRLSTYDFTTLQFPDHTHILFLYTILLQNPI